MKKLFLLCATLLLVSGCGTHYTNPWHTLSTSTPKLDLGEIDASFQTHGLVLAPRSAGVACMTLDPLGSTSTTEFEPPYHIIFNKDPACKLSKDTFEIVDGDVTSSVHFAK